MGEVCTRLKVETHWENPPWILMLTCTTMRPMTDGNTMTSPQSFKSMPLHRPLEPLPLRPSLHIDLLSRHEMAHAQDCTRREERIARYAEFSECSL